MHCMKCGTPFDGKFCPNCGTPVSQNDMPPKILEQYSQQQTLQNSRNYNLEQNNNTANVSDQSVFHIQQAQYTSSSSHVSPTYIPPEQQPYGPQVRTASYPSPVQQIPPEQPFKKSVFTRPWFWIIISAIIVLIVAVALLLTPDKTKQLSTYPLSLQQKYVDAAIDTPPSLYTTSAEENGSSGNIYKLSGKVLSSAGYNFPEEIPPTIVIETEYGKIMIMNMYYSICQSLEENYGEYDTSLLEDDVSDYIMPLEGEKANFICVYWDYDTEYQMPVFILGANQIIIDAVKDSADSDNSADDLIDGPISNDTSYFNEDEVLKQLSVEKYQYTDSLDTSWIFLVVKNNSDYNLSIEANMSIKDSDGKLIGASSSNENAVEKGTETILSFMCDETPNSIDYSIFVSEEDMYDCVVGSLSHEISLTENKAIVSITNNGSLDAEFVECTALFFKNGQLINHTSRYFTDDDSELKSGKTLSEEMPCYEEFDDVKLYFTGRHYTYK